MSKTVLIGAITAVALAAVAGAATAQQPAQASTRQAAAQAPVSRADFVERRVARLVAADANRDGTVTREERRTHAVTVRQQRAEARFDRLDADNDGKLSRDEFLSRPDARVERAGGERRPERMRRDLRAHGPRGERALRSGERAPVVIADVRARAEQTFARLDTDNNGVLSVEERRAGREAMRQQRRERGEQRRAAREASPQAPASE